MVQRGPQFGAAKNWWMGTDEDPREAAPILPPKLK